MYVIVASVLNVLIKKSANLSADEMKALAKKNYQALTEMGVLTEDPQKPNKKLLPTSLKNELLEWLPDEDA